MLDKLRKIDSELVELPSGNGRILISNALQGRIFAAFGNEIIHRFDYELALNPSQDDFNNIGGNSLWAAPEGGKYALFYTPDGQWRIQDAFNKVKTHTTAQNSNSVAIAKSIEICNRIGAAINLNYSRTVTALDSSQLPVCGPEIQCLGYKCHEKLTPVGKVSKDDMLLACWSLEQFPGAEGIIAFGLCQENAEGCINDDFYGSTASRINYNGKSFTFKLGGEKRLQIGVKTKSKPVLIGALDGQRGILVIRKSPLQPENALYFNTADNDQPAGPYSASDMFSVFNGSNELNFHELECISQLFCDEQGYITDTTLDTETCIFKGPVDSLKKLLLNTYNVIL